MSLEKNKAIIHSLYEAFNKQNLGALDDLMAPDYVDYSRQERGLESVKHYYTDTYKGFSDIHLTIQDITAERDKVWVRFKAIGTHIKVFWLKLPETYTFHFPLSPPVL